MGQESRHNLTESPAPSHVKVLAGMNSHLEALRKNLASSWFRLLAQFTSFTVDVCFFKACKGESLSVGLDGVTLILSLLLSFLSLVMEGTYSIRHKQVTGSSHHLEEGIRQVDDSLGSPKGMSGTIGMFLSWSPQLAHSSFALFQPLRFYKIC